MKQLIKKIVGFFGYDVIRKLRADEQQVIAVEDNDKMSEKYLWLNAYDISDVIDVGANEGQFALWIKKVLPNVMLHCFEPLEQPRSQLIKYLQSHPGVVVHPYGLGESNSEIEINLNEYTPSSSILPMLDLHKQNFDFAVGVKKEVIVLKRLDDIEFPDFKANVLLKVDVQGYEMHVLKGGMNFLKRVRYIIIETSFYPLYEGQPLFKDIYDKLTSHGFRYAGNVDQLIGPVNHQILQADALFIRE